MEDKTSPRAGEIPPEDASSRKHKSHRKKDKQDRKEKKEKKHKSRHGSEREHKHKSRHSGKHKNDHLKSDELPVLRQEDVDQLLEALQQNWGFSRVVVENPVHRVPGKNSIAFGVLCQAIESGRSDIALALVELGVDVNGILEDGYTPVHLAALNGDTELVKSLIDFGADYTADYLSIGTAGDIAKQEGYETLSRYLLSLSI